jgi:hypothetical protein
MGSRKTCNLDRAASLDRNIVPKADATPRGDATPKDIYPAENLKSTIAWRGHQGAQIQSFKL